MPYKTKNSLNSKDIFFKRATYLIKSQEQTEIDTGINGLTVPYENFIDFHFGEKQLYGRVGRNFVPITIVDLFDNIKTISSPSNDQTQHRAACFVVDQFNELKKQFDKCQLIGKISPNEEFLSNLVVHKSYTPPDPLYRSYYRDIFVSIKNNLDRQNITVSNKDDFLNEVVPLLLTISKTMPITKQHFLKSTFCPISVSGLVLEIANLDPTNDEEKVTSFFNNRNWNFYLNTCRSFGFMVDQEVPWRIVADIGSQEMLNRAATYGFNSTSSILIDLFSYRINSNFNAFKQMLEEAFITLLNDKVELKQCSNGSITQSIKQSINNFNLIEDSFFIDLLFKLRLNEEAHGLTEAEQLAIREQSVRLAVTDKSDSIFKFELMINQPFRYSGSLTDIINKQREIDDLSGT